MLVEAFPRLAVRLRETFPDASVDLVDGARSLVVGFPAFPAWEVRISGMACREHFQVIETSIGLHYDSLRRVPDTDFNRFVAAENLGLRGATIVVDNSRGPRTLKLRSTFIGQKGRTRDEAENLAIDVISLFRFARMLEDRILRSTTYDLFSYEMYHSQYLSKSIGRSRYINYARNIFQGSTDRVFGQVARLFKDDHKYNVDLVDRGLAANLKSSATGFEITARIPEEIPMITCSAVLHSFEGRADRSFDLVARLNQTVRFGHFEVSSNGKTISFVTWKHLTNDLRLYSLDQMLHSIYEAEALLKSELSSATVSPHEPLKGDEDRTEALESFENRSVA